jgi:hemolysin activation/secretion protein
MIAPPARLIVLAALAWSLPNTFVCAQQTIRPEIDPGQVQKRIPLPVAPERPPPTLQLPPPAPASPTAGAQAHFVLAGVVIDGATAVDETALTPLYEEYLAREIDLADVERILHRITARYRAAGFFLSRALARPQALDQGVLHITVDEGYVRQVLLRGARPGDEERLARFFTEVTHCRPLRLTTVERALLVANDLSGVHLTARLEPVDDVAGAYDLVLGVEYHRIAGFASFDNRGTESLGPWQAQLSGSISSLISAFDRLQLSFFTTANRPSELVSTELLYDTPVNSSGTRLALSVARTDLKPGGSLAPQAIDGTAMRYTARVTHPLIRGRDQSLWLGAVFDALDSTESENGGPLFDDHLRVLRATANYTVNDGGNANDAYVEASQGLSVLGASRAGAAGLSRGNGRADFTKVAASLTRQQTLGEQWSLQMALAGQKAAQPLLLPEQFALGGTRFGRAYDPAEITGDDAVAGSLELRYGRFVESRLLRSYQIYAFYDVGAVWNQDVGDGTQRQSLASVGGGMRLALPQNVAAGLEIAKALTRRVGAEGDKPVRVFISLSASF